MITLVRGGMDGARVTYSPLINARQQAVAGAVVVAIGGCRRWVKIDCPYVKNVFQITKDV